MAPPGREAPGQMRVTPLRNLSRSAPGRPGLHAALKNLQGSHGNQHVQQLLRDRARVRQSAAAPLVQRWPGDGLMPPGTCPWGTYLPLRAAVESAKAIVNTLGACAPGDSCLFLATKIAAITAELAARVALDTTCFLGGNAGHRQQVIDKVNMLNRCYRFFTGSNCPQRLVEAMEAVVARAREVVAALAMAIVAVALVIALIAALVVLVEAIIAAIAAAGAAAATAAAAAAVLAVIVLIRDQLSERSETPPTA